MKRGEFTRRAFSLAAIHHRVGSGGTRAWDFGLRQKKGPAPTCRAFWKYHSHSAGDLTRTEAAGADVHVLGRAVHDRLDALHIGLPGAVRAAVRVGHLNAERNTLIAKLAFGHFLEPPRWSKYQLILDSNQSIE